MPTVNNVRHVIAVESVEKTSRWFQDVLGFEEYFAEGDNWRFVRFGSCIVMMGQCVGEVPASDTGNHSYVGYWDTDDADVLYEMWLKGGAEIIKHVRSEPWGMREFGIRTPDGHRFMIGQRLAQ